MTTLCRRAVIVFWCGSVLLDLSQSTTCAFITTRSPLTWIVRDTVPRRSAKWSPLFRRTPSAPRPRKSLLIARKSKGDHRPPVILRHRHLLSAERSSRAVAGPAQRIDTNDSAPFLNRRKSLLHLARRCGQGVGAACSGTWWAFGARLRPVAAYARPETRQSASPTPNPPSPTTSRSPRPTIKGLVVDLPMIRLSLPRTGVGRDYVAVSLKIQGQGPFVFMVDTGLTTELITPHLQQALSEINKKSGGSDRTGPKIRGLAAGGTTQEESLVLLKNAALVDPSTGQEFPLPPLTAAVADFPQEHVDPRHDPVEGMLGMEFLLQFDVDLDFPAGRLRLWKPGTAAAAAAASGLVHVPAFILNETLLLGTRVTTAALQQQGAFQPVLAFLDCGSTFSVANWQAARYLGLPPRTDESAYAKGPVTAAVGVDGRPMYLPMQHVQLTVVGDPLDKTNRQFAPPSAPWQPWDPTLVGIGDLPVFSQVLGDGKSPFEGPAVLLGLDILAQRRIILESSKSIKRRLFISPQ